MARYERGDEFWDIARDGATLTIIAGAIGTPGTTTVEQLPSPAIASARWNVLLNQQGRAGWKLVKPPKPEVKPLEPALPEPIVHDARNLELERAIEADPENAELFVVYGDWLQGQGDPRGKLIALEQATIGKPYNDQHHAAVRRFVDKHRAYLYGGFVEQRGQSLYLDHGFIRHITLLAGRLAAPLSRLLAMPAARFVTRIHLDVEAADAEAMAEDEDLAMSNVSADFATALAVIATDAPRTLRHLAVGGEAGFGLPLNGLEARLPELRSFSLASISDREIYVTRDAARMIATAPWPRLRQLVLEILRGDCRPDDVVPLFARTDLPALVDLGFRTTFDDALVEALVTSPLAAQLESLTFEAPGGNTWLAGATFDGFAELLLTHRARFPKLAHLGIPHLRFSPAAIRELAVFGKVFDADGQDRYANSVE